MQIDQLKPNVIVTGPIFSEPVQVLIVTPMGASVKLIGQGLNTNQVHQLILNIVEVLSDVVLRDDHTVKHLHCVVPNLVVMTEAKVDNESDEAKIF